MATACIDTTQLAKPVGRLAPSPSGRLHLGNARSFLLAWLSIRQQNGSLILRIEDIDSPRVKQGAVESTVDDLRWLGLDWDYGPESQHILVNSVATTQSQRMDRYRQVLQTLIDQGCVYRCTCTRSQIAQAAASAPHEANLAQLEGPIYAGTCRNQLAHMQSFRFQADDEAALRWAFQSGSVCWDDRLRGQQTCEPAQQLGDFVIGRATGTPAYQLAVVVDDFDMGVTEIVRGDDLMLSTFRQQAILRQLNWPTPQYCHVPLVLDADGRRMAKRQGDSVAWLRSQNISPQVVVGYLAHSLGLIPRSQPIAPSELIGLLDWQRIPKQPLRFSGRLF